MRPAIKGFPLALLLLLLAGCALLRPLPEHSLPPATSAKAWLRSLQAWHIEGRFAVQGRERVSGKLSWHHRTQRDDLLLSGPLGMGAISLRITPQQVEVRRGSERLKTASPEEFFSELLGLEVPWEAFHYWIRGLPAPGEASLHHREDGYLAELRQQGWRVIYHRYLPFDPAALPKRLTLLGPGKVQLKLIIDRWQIEKNAQFHSRGLHRPNSI